MWESSRWDIVQTVCSNCIVNRLWTQPVNFMSMSSSDDAFVFKQACVLHLRNGNFKHCAGLPLFIKYNLLWHKKVLFVYYNRVTGAQQPLILENVLPTRTITVLPVLKVKPMEKRFNLHLFYLPAGGEMYIGGICMTNCKTGCILRVFLYLNK